MDRLQGMQVFVRVAQQLGFAAAARELSMSPAAVTKHINALEAGLGTRLFDRTTRRVALTEAGRVYLERCIECLQAVEDADAALSDLTKQPAGVLRITAPLDFRDSLAPVVADVLAAHPHIVVNLQLSNRVVDLVEEGVDVAVRAAHSLDGRYVARPIARTRLALLAAPSYLARHGAPRAPQDVASHRSIVFTEPRPMMELSFRRGDERVRVEVRPVMFSNDGAALMAAARDGLGLVVAPSFMTRADLDAGRLQPLLSDWTLPEFGIHAVYPHRRLLSPKVRAFVDALAARYGDGSSDPWWPSRPERAASRGRRNPAAAGELTGAAGVRTNEPI